MDLDGIDVSVVYPANAIFVYLEPDRELALACMRSYNDWLLDDFQGANQRRIVGLPMLPVDDGMDVCVAELERVARGARGAFIPGLPQRPYHDPYYEPLWARAAAMGIPLTFHRTFGGRPSDQDWDELVEQGVTAAGTAFRFFSGVRPLTYMTFAGVFERHPALRIVAGEVNCGWVPFWAQTMNQQFENVFYRSTGAVTLKRTPSEVMGDNVFFTVLDDWVGFELIANGSPRLADACMFSTDYPHSVTLWPNSQKYAAELTAKLTESDRTKVLSGTRRASTASERRASSATGSRLRCPRTRRRGEVRWRGRDRREGRRSHPARGCRPARPARRGAPRRAPGKSSRNVWRLTIQLANVPFPDA